MKLSKLKKEHASMEQQRAQFEDERSKVYEELHKIQKKLEDEIRLRLFFESKLNSLHHINMEHESRYKLISEKYEKLTFDHAQLEGQYNNIKSEHTDLVKFKSNAEFQLNEYKLKIEVDGENKS